MEERLGRQLAMTGKVVREQFDRALADVGSSLNTFVVLRTVASGRGVSQRQLASALGIEGPTMTHHLDRLAADGLLRRVRSPSDRRVSGVELTDAGRAHLDQVQAYAEQLDHDFRSLFTPSEIGVLTELLARIRNHYSISSEVADGHASNHAPAR